MPPSSRLSLRLACLLALPALSLAAHNFDCSDIVKDGIRFNLKSLAGPHVLYQEKEEDSVFRNMTYTIDICKPLKRTKNVPEEDECRPGARVCGIEYVTSKTGNNTIVEKVISIAGDFLHAGGWDPTWSLLRNSGSHADADREGLLVELNGGRHPFEKKKNGVKQKAVIEFICDHDRTGLEGDEEDDGSKEDGGPKEDAKLQSREDEPGDEDKKSLQFRSYKREDKMDVLRLNWRTKYACEDAIDNPDPSQQGGWGFFTWFLIILFLAISAYLIFGSWLNYNRYGARGWDLLPHGDTIRDIPYLMKDWGRKVVHTVQGGGSRGAYSAI